MAGMSKSPECIYDNGQLIAGKSTSIIIIKDIDGIHPLLLQALINSNVVEFWFRSYFKSLSMADGYFNVNQNELNKIPVPVNPLNISCEIVKLVETLNAGNLSDNEATLKDINSFIYELYKLDGEETSIIEVALK